MARVDAARLSGSEQERAQSISDLFAWCGGGELTPHQLHAYLRPQPALGRPRAAALLLRAPSGRRYAVTTCGVLSDADAAQPSIEPGQGEGAADDRDAAPVRGLTEIAFSSGVPAAQSRGWFPSVSAPHLDLSAIRLDEAGPQLCDALEAAGHAFAALDWVADGPAPGDVEVATPAGAFDDGHDARHTFVVAGRVGAATPKLSFFWLVARPGLLSGAPLISDGRVVGVYAPGRLDVSAGGARSGAAATKSAAIKSLIAAAEGERSPS